MMKSYRGWLIYDEVGSKRNQWFAEHLLEGAGEFGLELELYVIKDAASWQQDLPLAVAEGEEKPFCAAESEAPLLPDFCIMRVIAPQLSAYLEQRGVRVFNNARTSRIANSKWLTYEKALEWELPVLQTVLWEQVKNGGTQPMNYPVVIKAVAGHGGSQVYLAQEEMQRDACIHRLHTEGVRDEEIILQKLCDQPGMDMRIYALKGEIVAAVLRTSEEDFRSNYSLGGQIALAEPTAEQRRIVALLAEKLQFDFVGIDFIRHQGEWILNEIEDVVGTRMLYQLTELDAAYLLLQHIQEELCS